MRWREDEAHRRVRIYRCLCYGQRPEGPARFRTAPRLHGIPTSSTGRACPQSRMAGAPASPVLDSLRCTPRKLLGQILLEAGVMTQETLEAALMRAQRSRRADRRGADRACARRAADDVLRALATQAGLPFLSARGVPVRAPVMKNLSPKYLQEYVACPVPRRGRRPLTLAAADPTNPVLLDDLARAWARVSRSAWRRPRPSSRPSSARTAGSTALQKIVEGMAAPTARATARRTSRTSATWRSRPRWSGW